MCDVPFFFFPLCFQCGTDQNPCRCKVVGPTLGTSVLSRVICLLLAFSCTMHMDPADIDLDRILRDGRGGGMFHSDRSELS